MSINVYKLTLLTHQEFLFNGMKNISSLYFTTAGKLQALNGTKIKEHQAITKEVKDSMYKAYVEQLKPLS